MSNNYLAGVAYRLLLDADLVNTALSQVGPAAALVCRVSAHHSQSFIVR